MCYPELSGEGSRCNLKTEEEFAEYWIKKAADYEKQIRENRRRREMETNRIARTTRALNDPDHLKEVMDKQYDYVLELEAQESAILELLKKSARDAIDHGAKYQQTRLQKEALEAKARQEDIEEKKRREDVVKAKEEEKRLVKEKMEKEAEEASKRLQAWVADGRKKYGEDASPEVLLAHYYKEREKAKKEIEEKERAKRPTHPDAGKDFAELLERYHPHNIVGLVKPVVKDPEYEDNLKELHDEIEYGEYAQAYIEAYSADSEYNQQMWLDDDAGGIIVVSEGAAYPYTHDQDSADSDESGSAAVEQQTWTAEEVEMNPYPFGYYEDDDDEEYYYGSNDATGKQSEGNTAPAAKQQMTTAEEQDENPYPNGYYEDDDEDDYEEDYYHGLEDTAKQQSKGLSADESKWEKTESDDGKTETDESSYPESGAKGYSHYESASHQ
ncbi:hypothetical protein BJ508DRAFT_419193 [Ascobolus immersus RN42]|uniref:Uncharacterized protein n=1 Tax=Ascobolus immersus RN42 TaxID=1160509 RepID=A0A3N4HME9_ASCIM|nr:hypothetical protein BJ508DRAFT_419193 [Ascobolus immersus RN42]